MIAMLRRNQRIRMARDKGSNSRHSLNNRVGQPCMHPTRAPRRQALGHPEVFSAPQCGRRPAGARVMLPSGGALGQSVCYCERDASRVTKLTQH